MGKAIDTADKPLEHLADTERALDADRSDGPVVVGSAPRVTTDPPREIPATERLRAFEDETFGPDASRIAGDIERGSGSRFQELTAAQRRYYAALQALVPAEARVSEAAAALTLAEADHAAALDDAEQSSGEI